MFADADQTFSITTQIMKMAYSNNKMLRHHMIFPCDAYIRDVFYSSLLHYGTW